MGTKDQGADATQHRWLVIPRSMCLITHGDDVLLLKRGAHKRVMPNKYNGVGGHIERDEDILTSLLREVEEESGLHLNAPRLRGVINIDAGHSSGIMLFVFTAEARSREFHDCDEGTLEWVPLGEVYSKDLVEDFPYILPLLFGEQASDQPFFAHTSYDEADQLRFRIKTADE